MITGCPVVALALQLAALPISSRVAQVLTPPSFVTRRADAGTGDGIAEGLVLALAAVATVGSPVFAVAACKKKP